MLDETQHTCFNCRRNVWITALDRLHGSWVCLGCGTTNTYAREKVRKAETLPCPENDDMPDTLPSGSAMTMPPTDAIRCWCGVTVLKNKVHYPAGDPENGPAHLPKVDK